MTRVTKTIKTKSNERRVVYNCDMCEYYGTPKCDVHACQVRALERLAECEDAGRTPEEVEELVKENDTLREQLAVALKYHKTDCDDCKYLNVQQCEDHDYLCTDCPVVEACHCKDCEGGNKWVWAGGK